MIFQHARFQIWNQNQHPFVHSLSDFGYSSEALPGVTDMESALNYIIAVLYPNSKPAVATPAALPAVGNSINDYRVVQDDGDGKAASYRWYLKEGDAAAAWHKVLDLDWGTDSILQAWQNNTQGLFVLKNGYDDIDETGAVISGLFAGQHVFGGRTSGSNLTLSANSGDAAGPQTGYVQVTDDFRPTLDASISLGLATHQFLKGWFVEGQFGTLNLQGGLITDSSGAISFGNENLTTTGTITSGTLVLAAGSITDTSGAISFGNENLTTTGQVTASNVVATTAASQFFTGTSVADFTFTNGNIASTSATVNFNALNLSTSGGLIAGQLDIDGIVRINSNTISVQSVNTSLVVQANGTGVIIFGNGVTTSNDITMTSATLTLTTSTLNLTGQANFDNLRLDANTLSTTNANGNLVLSPNGTGQVEVSSVLYPQTTASYSLGKSGQLWSALWVSGSIEDGTNAFTISDLMTLRSANFRDAGRTLPAQAGDALFYNGSIWLASAPDTEIDHGSLSGLTTGDAGHTQFALLAGRAGGQALIGGIASGEFLDLESTAHATKGFIRAKDTIRPFTAASYSGGWSGIDLGHSSFYFKDIYSKGEHFGLRVENVGSLPSSSSQNPGRLVYLSTDENLYLDTGTVLKQVGGSRYFTDTVWDGSTTVKNVTVSGADARLAIWQLKDNSNDFEVIYCSIKATSATNVLITVAPALPAGSYRLVGV